MMLIHIYIYKNFSYFETKSTPFSSDVLEYPVLVLCCSHEFASDWLTHLLAIIHIDIFYSDEPSISSYSASYLQSVIILSSSFLLFLSMWLYISKTACAVVLSAITQSKETNTEKKGYYSKKNYVFLIFNCSFKYF